MKLKQNLFLVLAMALSFSLSQCIILETISGVSTSLNSVSTGLGSISDSLKSISGSLTSSSGGDDKKGSHYYNDVKSLTMIALNDSLDSKTYLRELGNVARSHGIVDWRSMPSTVEAIGEGLKEAGVSNSDYQMLRNSLTNTKIVAVLDSGYFAM
ncbi:MAG: putative lipoprotein [Leptonema sp. (in: Bacteria)]|nr:putative lipoprotein [Leptonema sp. (in: bacteria)]